MLILHIMHVLVQVFVKYILYSYSAFS